MKAAKSIFSRGRSECRSCASGRSRASRPEPFSETLEQERETVHGQLVRGLQKASPELPSALAGNEWFARLEKLLGFLGAMRYTRRVRQAKKHVHKVKENVVRAPVSGKYCSLILG